MTILAAGVPVIAAAIIAGRASKSVRRFELTAQRIRDLEDRLHEKKYEVYKPMVNMLSDLIGANVPEGEDLPLFLEKFKEFSTWIVIYGSDEAVIAFQRFMQGAFKNAPTIVTMRLYADFILAARKDMGYPDTAVRRDHLIGLRINDIYDFPLIKETSLARLCDQAEWTPPWSTFEEPPARRFRRVRSSP
ncbi:hypothetical protein [Amycolatopsis sp. NBRC 101858]|uniref:hypothetical protein n=1 Tax=Amycolatopsis sp. NBRC 101858 TaxID=3032200 RepID=UPI0025549723|nr:hypothetical protein [Amycolatopsis sp. NBRC 101858]